MLDRSGDKWEQITNHAIKHPNEWYRELFKTSRPRPILVNATGRIALGIVRPTLIFPGDQSLEDYENSLGNGPLIVSSNHPGKKGPHDISELLAAVFRMRIIRDDLENVFILAAASHFRSDFMRPLLSRHGAIPTYRRKDMIDDISRDKVNEALFGNCAEHISRGGNLVIMVPGALNSNKVRPGIGHIAERAERKLRMQNITGHIVTLAMWSKNSATGLIPRGAVVSFGEPIELGAGNEPRSSETFLDLIVASQAAAMSRIPREAA